MYKKKMPIEYKQIGQAINGEADDNISRSVSLSSDGSVVAIGAPNSGQVRIYKLNGNAWYQIGDKIDGAAANDQSGYSVSLSSDGSVVAIGAPNSGQVRIYKLNGNAWYQIGDKIDGAAANDQSGYSVSLSSDGSVIAIGSVDSGHVRIYKWNRYTWGKRGDDIVGEGISVSLSSDGSVVAIGAPLNGATGHVSIYKWNGSAWHQIGDDIDGEAAEDYSGVSVSLSSDGSVVAIGAPGNDGNCFNSGHVRIYKWNGDTWVQIGTDIDGESDNRSGFSVSLSSDGSVVAIGALYDKDTVLIYEWNGSAWVILYDIDSVGVVSLSSNGKIVAIGFPYNNSYRSGQVRIYNLLDGLIPTTIKTNSNGNKIIITYDGVISGTLVNDPVLTVNGGNYNVGAISKNIDGKKIILSLEKNILKDLDYNLEYDLDSLTIDNLSLANINQVITNDSTFNWFTENQNLKNKIQSISFGSIAAVVLSTLTNK